MALPTSGLSFLDLPFPVRRRIYLFTGLLRYCPIGLNHEGPSLREEYLQSCLRGLIDIHTGSSPSPSQQLDWKNDASIDSMRARLTPTVCTFQCKKWQDAPEPMTGPYQIGCICRPVPWELFLVCRSVYKEVKALFYSENQFKICDTDPGGLEALWKLDKVALGAINSLHIRVNAWTPELRHGTDLQVPPTDSRSKTFSDEWHKLALYLGANITAENFKLGLACDLQEPRLDMAKQITLPLQDWPVISHCAIRLRRHPNRDIQLVAQTAAQKITKRLPSRHSAFRWSDLPVEIQIQILQHTGLVVRGKISWLYGHFHGLGPDRCCYRCTPTLEACYCSCLHAAYSTASCACRPWPKELFLANKSLHEQALQMAFGSNEFELRGHGSRREGVDNYQAILKVLTSFPVKGLPYIRSLRLVLGGHGRRELYRGTKSLASWREVLDFIKRHFDVPKLNLAITTEHLRMGLNQDLEETEWRYFQRIAAPTVVLKNAGSISIRFAPLPLNLGKYDNPAQQARNRDRERQLEQMLVEADTEKQAWQWLKVGRIIDRNR